MGIVNRILAVLILICALAAAFGAYKLSEKRQELVDNKANLAKAVNQVAGELDKGSETAIKNQLDPEKIKTPEDIQSATQKAVNQAKDIIAQRDELSNRLSDITKTLNIPNFRETDFMSVEQYGEKGEALNAAVKKVKERNDETTKSIAGNSEKLGLLIDENVLKSENYADSLKKYNDKVSYFKTKHDKLVNHSKTVANSLGIQSPNLSVQDYEPMLQATLEEVKNYRQNADQTKNDLNVVRRKIKIATKKIEKIQSDYSQATGENKKLAAKLQKAIEDLEAKEKQLADAVGLSPEESGNIKNGKGKGVVISELYRKLKGKVIEVNRKWGFVVLDLKKKNSIEDENLKNITMPANQEMIVARGLGEDNQFVGKIKVTKVFDNCSVANVLPEPKALPVQVGDIVYFGEVEKEEEPVKTLDEAEKEEEVAAPIAPVAPKKAEKAKKAKKADDKKDEGADEEEGDDKADKDEDDDEEEEDFEEEEEF